MMARGVRQQRFGQQQFRQRQFRHQRFRVLSTLLGILALFAVVAGCSGGSLTTANSTITSTAGVPVGSSESGASAASSTATTTTVPPVASVSGTPALGATGLSPSEPITVTVAKGTIDALTLTN